METTKRQHTVLVVEDEMPLMHAIMRKFEMSGYAVISARSVDQAFGYLENIKEISAIWLDHYLLGKKDGLDFVRKAKANKATKSIPIFVISNTATPEKVEAYLKMGINKYYTKSDHRLDEIVTDVDKIIENNK
jgi:response regulator RpfG family c-di-GMP phosphodiesterase